MATVPLDYKRRIAGAFKHEEERKLNSDGTYQWNPHFLKRLKDYEDVFNMLSLDLITSKIGTEGWDVCFAQVEQLTPSFFADIFVDNPHNFEVIKYIIENRSPEIKIQSYYFQGDVELYVARYS